MHKFPLSVPVMLYLIDCAMIRRQSSISAVHKTTQSFFFTFFLYIAGNYFKILFKKSIIVANLNIKILKMLKLILLNHP